MAHIISDCIFRLTPESCTAAEEYLLRVLSGRMGGFSVRLSWGYNDPELPSIQQAGD